MHKMNDFQWKVTRGKIMEKWAHDHDLVYSSWKEQRKENTKIKEESNIIWDFSHISYSYLSLSYEDCISK